MSTATLVFLVDIQNGFALQNLTRQQGGSLYVPGGEEVGEFAARLVRNLANATIVLSQDYHPADHISFASNHPGTTAFSNIRLRVNDAGIYVPAESGLLQTLWLDHCIQGTRSALFVDELMEVLPTGLREKLLEHSREPTLKSPDGRGNMFYVVRKGMRRDLDSYGISTENDGISKTAAPDVFSEIVGKFQGSGVTAVNIYMGGLATNYCVEFSHRDVWEQLIPQLKAMGIQANVSVLTDISRGIPLAVPDGSWPDLAAAPKRMEAFGSSIITTDTAIRRSMSTRRYGTRQLLPHVS